MCERCAEIANRTMPTFKNILNAALNHQHTADHIISTGVIGAFLDKAVQLSFGDAPVRPLLSESVLVLHEAYLRRSTAFSVYAMQAEGGQQALCAAMIRGMSYTEIERRILAAFDDTVAEAHVMCADGFEAGWAEA